MVLNVASILESLLNKLKTVQAKNQEIVLADYRICFGAVNEILSEFLAEGNYSKVFYLVDENTYRDCWPLLKIDCASCLIMIESGENEKNIETCQEIWEQLLEEKADRNSLLINLGGGVIGDMGGFAASTFKRGIDFVQIPTTLLAMVDASIGGKLAVDFGGVKNSVGLFRNPALVIIDEQFLDTLQPRELRSGLAELFKHGMISEKWLSSKEMLSMNKSEFDEQLILPSILVKKEIVEQDPFEKGLRKALNFGHTIGHAFEALSLQEDADPLLHGEAVAIGMICELFLSVEKCGFPEEKARQLQHYWASIYPSAAKIAQQKEQLLAFMLNDKKNKGGKIKMALLADIGQMRLEEECTVKEIETALTFYVELVG